ncbi:MAG TPA: ATP phosphoribosyltransferase regulatory subunit, partial [Candidatus Cloacimonadota bacterium]|nr:ATP phosphoribosyltransferase regulatory subunit [Candidatus Cloacimonadota bacterium]
MQNSLPGLHHFMPDKVWKWKLLEQKVDHVLSLHDYQEIRLSVLQDYHVIHDGITALMQESEANQATEGIVNLSQPNGDISLLTLRPEGTISVLHHAAKVIRDKDVHRYYYLGPMFRKIKDSLPNEFFQLGVELLGSSSIMSENEVISIGMKICHDLGLRDVFIRLNSFGCNTCRHGFFEDMRKYLSEHQAEFCDSCYQSLHTNPLADTNCQNPRCQQAIAGGPQIG